jgi:hypothetical protein
MSSSTREAPQDPQRRPYLRPQLGRVRVEADQVLAIGCKSTGFGDAPLATPCALGTCSGAGS